MNNPTTTEEETRKSAVQTLHEMWEANGSELPSRQDQKRLLKALKAALEMKEAAEQAELDANAAIDAASREIIEAMGRKSVEISGVVYDPSCRGDAVFYRPRKKTGSDIISM